MDRKAFEEVLTHVLDADGTICLTRKTLAELYTDIEEFWAFVDAQAWDWKMDHFTNTITLKHSIKETESAQV